MVVIVGHRGAGKLAPENSLEGFQKAIEIGCGRTEMDVMLTKDNILIIAHDITFPEKFGFLPRDRILDEIRQIGDVPTLQEVIQVCKGNIDMQIELKASGTPAAVNDHLLRNDIVGSTVVTSFNIGWLEEMRSLNPDVKLCLLFKEIPDYLWKTAKRLKLNSIGPKGIGMHEGIIKKVHKKGLEVYAFGVNDKELGERMIADGVDAIGTDHPEMFLESF